MTEEENQGMVEIGLKLKAKKEVYIKTSDK